MDAFLLSLFPGALLIAFFQYEEISSKSAFRAQDPSKNFHLFVNRKIHPRT